VQETTPASRAWPAILAAAIIAARVAQTRNPFDWIVLSAALWLCVSLFGESRKVVAPFVLTFLLYYLSSQLLHMLAVADLIP
jgi:hypothetical protein